MQRHRFYSPPEQLMGSSITLAADEAHHLSRVLRLTPGEAVYAFDGQGAEYECEVQRVGHDSVVLQVLSRLANEVESPLQLTLAQGLTKGDKFDWIVQKAVELGATRFVPLVTEHAEIRRLDGLEGRYQRWRRIALEATKQCGRRRVMELADAQSFQELCTAAITANGSYLLFSEKRGSRLEGLERSEAMTVIVGPEGGWSENELQLAEDSGIVSIHLGKRILRSETAAVTALALAQYLFGDLG